jgi:hypothetical protein
MFLHNQPSTWRATWDEAAYKAAGAGGKLQQSSKKVDDVKVVQWLLR